MAEWMELAGNLYAGSVPEKPGVRTFLERMRARGERMAVVTSAVPVHCRSALTHLGLLPYFERIFFAQELGMEKKTPELWKKVAAELNAAMPAARELLMRRMASNGVTVVDPVNTYVDPRCSVAPGVTLLPGTILRGHTAIAAGCEIGPNSMVRDCIVGKDTTINASQVNESTIGSHTTVGPFTYVRPGCRIGDHCRVGDFVEVKNSVIGDGTKISHLTYVGDSDVGRRVNFGCGTVTTNYDGHKKFRCTIGDDAFLGCNTNLIAPVTVGDRAYTAAGSTVTDNVPDGALAIARARQTNKEGWADRLRALWKKNQ